MRWLRTQRDLIGLIAVWGILLQSLALPFATGLHAATLASNDADFALLCSTRGTISATVPGATPEDQSQNRNGADCPCSMACHAGCGAACAGGLLPSFARVLLPGDATLAASAPRFEPLAASPLHTGAHQRAPPLSFS